VNGGFQSKKAQENAKEKNLQGKDSPAKQDTRTKQPKQLHRTKLCSSIPPGRRTHSPRRHEPSQQHQLIQTHPEMARPQPRQVLARQKVR